MVHDTARCWACGSLNRLPVAADSPATPAPLFKCAWCAALNSPEGNAASTADPAAPRLMLKQVAQRRRLTPSTVAGYVLMAIVVVLVGSIFVLASSLVMPALFSPLALTTMHLPIAALLVINILFNYAACITRHPGPVQHHLQQATLDSGGHVQRHGLEGCGYCTPCGYYKPPQAHHCSTYVNNCVGSATLRHFILFLSSLVMGVAYGLGLGLMMGWKDRAVLWRHTSNVLLATSHMQPLLRFVTFSVRWLFGAPHWVACWAYFTFVCWATLLSVGLLLSRQVRLLLRGESYLDTLQYLPQQQGLAQAVPVAALAAPLSHADDTFEPATEPTLSAPAMQHVQRVFGNGHPLLWLLPAWDRRQHRSAGQIEMGRILDAPKWPVIDPAPGFGKTVSNFNLEDWGLAAAVTAISFPLGYLAGAQRSPAFAKVSGAMAVPTMWAAACMGGVAGFLLAYQNSNGRLMGLKPNEAEVRAYGRS
ncbi:Protein S-acyltransferase 11 [Chlorella vulgaris]